MSDELPLSIAFALGTVQVILQSVIYILGQLFSELLNNINMKSEKRKALTPVWVRSISVSARARLQN